MFLRQFLIEKNVKKPQNKTRRKVLAGILIKTWQTKYFWRVLPVLLAQLFKLRSLNQLHKIGMVQTLLSSGNVC